MLSIKSRLWTKQALLSRPFNPSIIPPRYFARNTPKPRSFSRTHFANKNTQDKPVSETGGKKKWTFPRIFRVLNLWLGATVIGGTTILAGLLTFDYFTYADTSSLALDIDDDHTKIYLDSKPSGVKNLPVAQFTELDPEKPTLVVLGCGWGSFGLLKRLERNKYNVILVSPKNYFLFTPLLPSVTVGTLNARSVITPIRHILKRVKGSYLRGHAMSIDKDNDFVEIQTKDSDSGEIKNFYIKYDKLVIGVGSQSITHGVKGLEHCLWLKTVEDSHKIRRKIFSKFEDACLPGISDEERKKKLSFVICGGGPTGVEFAAELVDMVHEELGKYFPPILRKSVSIHLLQGSDHILNTYDVAISKYAESKFLKDDVDLITNARVNQVNENEVLFNRKLEDGTIQSGELPYGMLVWTTGITKTELTSEFCDELEEQTNNRAIITDSHLRVLGVPKKNVYAIGDCATIDTNLPVRLSHFVKSLPEYSHLKTDDIQLNKAQFRKISQNIAKEFPQASVYLQKAYKTFDKIDVDNSGTIDMIEFKTTLELINKKLTSLPATAQRASQQGKYLAKNFNSLTKRSEQNEDHLDAFNYRHLGSLAYLGTSAVGTLPGIFKESHIISRGLGESRHMGPGPFIFMIEINNLSN